MGLTSAFEFPLKCCIPTWKVDRSPSALSLKLSGFQVFRKNKITRTAQFSKVLVADGLALI